jgi:diguanylate cyclase (GGDEF)-like protein
VTAIAALDGGAHSPTALVYFLTLVFAALSYPIASVVAVSVVSLVAFAGLAVFVTPFTTAERAGADYVWFFAVCLGVVGAMCVWQSQIQAGQRAHLRQLSRSDPLTGCLNRLGFAERFGEEIASARRHAASVGLIVLDLDGFKAVNDTLGHAAGDDLLRWVAATLSSLSRGGDVTGRLGGDEFTVMLRETDAAGLELSAARIRRALSERVQATTGVAAFPADGDDLDALLRHADAGLYAVRATTRRAAAQR